MSVTISGSGQIVKQVITVTTTAVFTTTSTMPTFVDVTGLSATITPTNSANKILVLFNGETGQATATNASAIQLLRGATAIYKGDVRGSATSCSAGGGQTNNGQALARAITFLDSPATTSATTYKIQLATDSVGGTALIGGTYNTGGAYNTSSPCTLTLMEIAYA